MFPAVSAPLERWFCGCVEDSRDLTDNGKPVERPTRVGGSILLYGRRKSSFPYHCMVGPDWPCTVLSLVLMVVVNTVVLSVISPLGWITVVIGIVGGVLFMVFFCLTAFSDPGIVYKNEFGSLDAELASDVENVDKSSQSVPLNAGALGTSTTVQRIPPVPHSIECGQCEIRRPYTARHCTHCGNCIDVQDHHCPW
jgi:palmitoyltransferase ZDHHC9/14/18